MAAEKTAFVCNCAEDYYSVSHEVLPRRFRGASAAKQIKLVMTDILLSGFSQRSFVPYSWPFVFIATDSKTLLCN